MIRDVTLRCLAAPFPSTLCPGLASLETVVGASVCGGAGIGLRFATSSRHLSPWEAQIDLQILGIAKWELVPVPECMASNVCTRTKTQS